ncbi:MULTISPECIES: ANTAR domain-containing protein [Rathayibacter]|uniref:ANTAR domain-containing protein n=1 Tax=Rathayibacter festucae TaxID=110937 RepID=A0ABX6GZ24_9MICO|nr:MULTISPECIES: ANTAR domain-containing protein [Rathayibacter]MCJ1674536.1 ANTAR domain-containing protein [Rathayibacter sp. VKM Ac-2929]MCJ1684817.1 ANTAR domain-containing protein [Rathayibacter sp. VKM Ac-2928]MCJ1687453.1 ANTAR domain-containing protein [Rathayibacter sp. VKM Ac-2927]MCJ1703723.1 ANTAR domain-containing protein [Rathayibacter sp. VKM Ac-2926]QHC62785.1 ANTAR domain-containing protein [Rathayibacter festucae]
MTEPGEEPGPFLSWVGALEEVGDDDVPVLQAVGFLSVSLRLSADAAFAALRDEARALTLDLREVASEVITFRRTIPAPE